MTKYTAIITALEGLEGPDREVEIGIHLAVGGSIKNGWYRLPETSYTTQAAAEYTASLDAAIALVKRVMPKNTSFGIMETRTSVCAKIYQGSTQISSECHPCYAIALLIAMFKALERIE